MSSLSKTWNRHKQICIFRDIFECNKVTLSCLKGSTIDQWLNLKFLKYHEIGISNFLIVCSASKCHLLPRLGIVISKLVYFEIYFIVTKWLFLVWRVQLWTHGYNWSFQNITKSEFWLSWWYLVHQNVVFHLNLESS